MDLKIINIIMYVYAILRTQDTKRYMDQLEPSEKNHGANYLAKCPLISVNGLGNFFFSFIFPVIYSKKLSNTMKSLSTCKELWGLSKNSPLVNIKVKLIKNLVLENNLCYISSHISLLRPTFSTSQVPPHFPFLSTFPPTISS